jgi:hypothetical protein
MAALDTLRDEPGHIHTRTYTFALAAARTKESSLLLGEATPHTPSPPHIQLKGWRKFRVKCKSKKRSAKKQIHSDSGS